MSAHYVYRCYDATGRLIYVGSTRNIFRRVDAHRSNSWWAPTVAKVTGSVHPTKAQALAAERRAIATENPRWNTLGKWAARASWGRQDYLDYIHAHRGRHTSLYVRKHLERVRRDMDLLSQQEAAA